MFSWRHQKKYYWESLNISTRSEVVYWENCPVEGLDWWIKDRMRNEYNRSTKTIQRIKITKNTFNEVRKTISGTKEILNIRKEKKHSWVVLF